MQERKVLLIEDNLGDARLVQEMLADSAVGVFIGEAFYTFQLDHQSVFHQEIGKVFPNGWPL